ncbi:MAG: putative DNA modification/repair radical SAM protein [Clostridia bacterium]|nr:putative DNA modification/repair radical SAM protein [Clostridia bacterium]
MDLQEKLKILGDGAKYDVSCSSSGAKSSFSSNKDGIGSAHISGICHSWTSDGRCVSLLKILMSNCCTYDCAYCINRISNDVPRATFTPEEIANITIEFYRRNYIEGLFLSSAVVKNPDYTMELMIKTLKLLRFSYRFYGYIHVKIIPGASSQLVHSIGTLADRTSVNIELPTEKSLKMFAPEKTKEAILNPMGFISSHSANSLIERKKSSLAPRFVPAGQTTQMIIGADKENDLQIMRLSQGLYDKYKLKRVYFSAYVPLGNHPNLPAPTTAVPLLREHRLYQADWLLRFYGFRAEELLNERMPNFSNTLDPKCTYALSHIDSYPVDVNRADYYMLLRVPGIGVVSAKRIVAARKHTRLTFDNLKKIGVVLKRAKYFITAADFNENLTYLSKEQKYLEPLLRDKTPAFTASANQVSLFDFVR